MLRQLPLYELLQPCRPPWWLFLQLWPHGHQSAMVSAVWVFSSSLKRQVVYIPSNASQTLKCSFKILPIFTCVSVSWLSVFTIPPAWLKLLPECRLFEAREMFTSVCRTLLVLHRNENLPECKMIRLFMSQQQFTSSILKQLLLGQK